jgi:pimeloyl-ACP methyl ester carboxylesterase
LSGQVALADGTKVAYLTMGDRSHPALFLGPHFHPSTANDENVAAWLGGLVEDYFLILADLPRGVGGSAKPLGREYGPQVAVKEILAVADAAEVDTFAWLGYSFGAAVGVQLACRTDRLTALAIGGFPPLGAPFAALAEILNQMAQDAERGVSHFDPLQIKSTAAFYEKLLGWPEHAEVARLSIPRLLFMGTEDSAETMPTRRRLPLAEIVRHNEQALTLLGWDVAWLPGQNHAGAMSADQALPVVRRFLNARIGRPSGARHLYAGL